jgi:hypothetical protein
MLCMQSWNTTDRCIFLFHLLQLKIVLSTGRCRLYLLRVGIQKWIGSDRQLRDPFLMLLIRGNMRCPLPYSSNKLMLLGLPNMSAIQLLILQCRRSTWAKFPSTTYRNMVWFRRLGLLSVLLIDLRLLYSVPLVLRSLRKGGD